MTGLRAGWVVLTIGSDPVGFAAALASIEAQTVAGPVVVVDNGAGDVAVPEWVDLVRLDRNVGIPAGRELGLRALPEDVDVVFFLDDDARYVHEAVAAEALEVFGADPRVAALSMCIVDADGNRQRRYVPRLGERGADRSGPVTTFAGCAHALRRRAFLAAGGYPAEFFYGHEEHDLAWRLLDAGHVVHYDARPAVEHPQVPLAAMDPARYGMLARNRVLLARRNLPTPLQAAYATTWLVGGLLALPRSRALADYATAWARAWRQPVQRRPMGWSTVWRMTRLGRPPVL